MKTYSKQKPSVAALGRKAAIVCFLTALSMVVAFPASATLIGTSVNILWQDDVNNTLDTVLVSATDTELTCPGSPAFNACSTQFMIGGESIDINEGQILIDLLEGPGFGANGDATLTFADLTWGSVDGFITGVTATSSLVGLTTDFGANFISVTFQANQNLGDVQLDFTTAHVPEPTTLVLLSLGLAGLGFTRRRMKK